MLYIAFAPQYFLTIINYLQELDIPLETGNWKLETGNWKLETGNWELGTGNLKLETGNWKPETGNLKLFRPIIKRQHGAYFFAPAPIAQKQHIQRLVISAVIQHINGPAIEQGYLRC